MAPPVGKKRESELRKMSDFSGSDFRLARHNESLQADAIGRRYFFFLYTVCLHA